MSSLAFKQQLYDTLYQAGSEVLKRADLCKISSDGKTCAGGTPCCGGCVHLGPSGCKVNALACKLWLCGKLEYSDGRVAKIAVIELRTLKAVGRAAGLPMGYRMSKDTNFSHLQDGYMPSDWGLNKIKP